MAHSRTNPPLIDLHALRLDVKSLEGLAALKESGRSARLQVTSEVGGLETRQTVEIVAVPARFGGRQFFFVCPITGKRARTLYRFGSRHGGRFAHRAAFPDACYSIQTLSKTDRIFATKHRTEEALRRAGLKTTYAGKPTRRFATLTRRLARAKDAEHAALFALLERLS